MTRKELKPIVLALETAYGCLDLVRANIKPSDLDECIAEVRAARDLAIGLLEGSDV